MASTTLLAQTWLKQAADGQPLSGYLALAAVICIVLLVVLLPRERRKFVLGPVLLVVLHYMLLSIRVAVPSGSEAHTALYYFSLFFLLASLGRSGFLFVTNSLVAPRFVRALPKIFLDTLQVLVYVALAIAVLKAADVDTSSLVTGSALITAAVVLLMKDTLGNIFAGLAIQVQRPFEVDDWIQFDELSYHIGKVLEINWRATKVITLDKVEVIIPNSTLADAPIRNFTKPKQHSRRSIFVVTPYDVPTGLAREIMLEAVSTAWGVLRDPAPSIVTNDFNERGVEHWIRIFTNEFDFRDKVDGAVRDRVWHALHRHGISIPGPLRHVELQRGGPQAEATKEEIQREERLETLRCADFLNDLPADALGELAKESRRRYYAEGEVIIQQGEAGKEFFIIVTGEVEVMVDCGDRTPPSMIGTLGATGFFGEIACMTGELRTATVRAKRDSELLVVDREGFRIMLEASPGLAEQMTQIIADRQANEQQHCDVVLQGDEKENDGTPGDLLNRIRNFFGLE